MRSIITRDNAGNRIPGAVGGRPPAPPPASGQPPAGSGGTSGTPRGGPVTVGGGTTRQTPTLVNGLNESRAAAAVANQTAGPNVVGETPFMQTPGMQIASQRVRGEDIARDPAISAALADFSSRVAPGIQNRATMSGLGRSTAALNALTQAQGSMLAPMYESAFGREQQRLSQMGGAAENELGRRERSAQRVAEANQNQAQLLMQLSNTMQGRDQATGQNLFGMGGTLRDIAQQGNTAEQQDFLRRQALGEQAVYAPFGGLAQGGLGSTTSSTGK